ncbi:BREX system Lon protease-like protein BrxL [Xiashengella succiniciproducens]|uniref:BREX system Lon protease-like protein BrxL n=1 Tax=Xiashengella succiniciproducens TaxID=2949635 RepID=A0A9J6ZSY8_9BACT|nr:BREX system Lon protease-like protein BrxL [Alkaliflexus sp. Ai-910]URW80667.1 BREX system Lon protease-like protein BrxL [Alkaliflexus sp. Ai-910]
MKELDKKTIEHFEGKVVRKDLTKLLKGNAVVPSYVLEYLLGQHCSTNDEEIIKHGIEKVKSIISNHFVHRDEAEVIKSVIREKGNHRIIDKISVKLNDKADRYEARFSNLGLNNIPIADQIVKDNPKILTEGVWSLINVAYLAVEERNTPPWIIESVKPIQISNVDIQYYKEVRSQFSTTEWMDLLMQSIGLNPEEFSTRSKLIQLARLIPFTENNYNLIELGPKGTGKSHIYSELSPHGILISGGEVSKAKLFVNNSNGNIGLVGYWDVIAYDEFAGKSKKVDRGLVDIMKNYMANKSFSRGTDVYQAEASMVFVGNTDHSVSYMMKHSHLFDALPKDYQDTAFLDRIHAYIPGWEVSKLRNELFTSDFGFIVDYIAEVLKALRKEDYSKLYQQYFTLSNSITTRDKVGIEKTFSGLIKILHPDLNVSKEDVKLILDFAIECRKRVKDQLIKMDETFNEDPVTFSYEDADSKVTYIQTLEELEYGKHLILSENSIVETKESIDEITTPISTHLKVIDLAPKTVTIRENQSNVSYDKLFGEYLVGVHQVTIVDPYIRMPYQVRNLMELIRLIISKRVDEELIAIHLKTFNSDDKIPEMIDTFDDLHDSLMDMDVNFTYEFDESIHDRSISLDNGWTISLGRGLDIWQRTGGMLDFAEYYQEKRICKEFSMYIVRGGK